MEYDNSVLRIMDAQEFLRKMEANDGSVWDDLMPMLRRVTFGACRDLNVQDSVIDDIVQDVAVRVFKNWQSFGGRSSLATWLYSIERNRILDELRKRKVRGENKPNANDEEDSSLQHEAGYDPRHELMLCVQQVLAELDSQGPARKNSHRMIDVLFYWVEHSPTTEELAKFLNTTVKAAKQRKYEIKKRIEELCRQFCGHDDCSLKSPESLS